MNRLFIRHQKVTPENSISIEKYQTSFFSKPKMKILRVLKSLKYYQNILIKLDYNYFLYKKLRKVLSSKDQNNSDLDNSSFPLLNIHFLKKERLYTKLKYSRSPAYDIVSGGSAALLAGFLGFLISEKYGFELVDSGDFYYFFMYIVFIIFSLRPLLFSINVEQNVIQIFSLRIFYEFYFTILYLGFYKLKY